MPKRLLYLEDNGYLLKQTLDFLKEDGYEVVSCKSIDQAICYLNNNPDGIDCIITDLNMDDIWLNSNRKESEGGLLSGWVWLKYYVFGRIDVPCIIYSGYIPELNRHLSNYNEYDLFNNHHVSCVRKGGNDDNGYEMLYKTLERVIKK